MNEQSMMIAPVTDELTSALTSAAGLLLATGGDLQSSRTVNDKETYAEVANELECLTTAVLGAIARVSLLGPHPIGARFDVGAQTQLYRHVTSCVAYLRDAASNLIQSGSLSQYDVKHTTEVMSRLKALYGLVTHGIGSRARRDLTALAAHSPSELVALAGELATTASHFVTLDADTEAEAGEAPFPKF